MEKPITKIKKVEIKGLWNRFDLSWTLNPDVNVLSGINGSGKSTILNHIIAQTLTVDRAIITFKDKTELDKVIFKLQKEYLDFQTNLSKKKDLIVDDPSITDVKKAIQELSQPHNRFLEIIDDLFGATDKKRNRAKNEIMFTCGNQEITPYQLSSGEKQMLVILLTVLIQDLRPAVLLMDEPEISLHFDWQKKFIQYIRELNPNVQIILATHSPAIIMEGWLDKVFDVSDLVTPIKINESLQK